MTFGDLLASFLSISKLFAPWYTAPKFSILIFSLVPSCILLSFYVFLIVLHFPFCFSWFLHFRLLIFMYTSLFYNKISSPLCSIPCSHSGLSHFCSYPSCTPWCNTPVSPTSHSCLEPISQPLHTLTPVTAIVLFVLGTASGVPAHQHSLVRKPFLRWW